MIDKLIYTLITTGFLKLDNPDKLFFRARFFARDTILRQMYQIKNKKAPFPELFVCMFEMAYG
jgi:hypothetical protein